MFVGWRISAKHPKRATKSLNAGNVEGCSVGRVFTWVTGEARHLRVGKPSCIGNKTNRETWKATAALCDKMSHFRSGTAAMDENIGEEHCGAKQKRAK